MPQFPSRDTLFVTVPSSWYAPNNIVITKPGIWSTRSWWIWFQENLAQRRKDDMAAAVRTAPSAACRHRATKQAGTSKSDFTFIVLGVPSYPVAHERRYGAALLNIILGGGMSSRLFQNIRERQGLAYAIFSELSPYTDSGVFSVYAGTSPESAAQLIRSVVEEFRRIRAPGSGKRRGVAPREDPCQFYDAVCRFQASARMSNLARQAMYFNRFVSLDEMLASIEVVTREEVLAIANDFFVSGVNSALTVLRQVPDGFRRRRRAAGVVKASCSRRS